jgi:hypothetical protein
MKKPLLTLLTCFMLVSPNEVMSETWICGYKVHGEVRLLPFERIPKGFKSEENINSILSETDRRIVLVSEYEESVFITILDKKHTEFISSGV